MKAKKTEPISCFVFVCPLHGARCTVLVVPTPCGLPLLIARPVARRSVVFLVVGFVVGFVLVQLLRRT